MIIIMKQNATDEQISQVVNRVKEEGLAVQMNRGNEQQIVGLVGDTRKIQDVAFQRYDGVEEIVLFFKKIPFSFKHLPPPPNKKSITLWCPPSL
ncbi:hypothetical protein K4E_22720 [Enterococcus thailandicus]|nr:hypothetical protein K4E_22720 [Enterococcus thailandicus]